MSFLGPNSITRFTPVVSQYVKYRPSYPAQLFKFLEQNLCMCCNVAELGAGTGIFSRQLALEFPELKIIAVEPNDHMRKAAELEPRENIIFHNGTAEDTGLPSQYVEAVLAAQAFHWFHPERTLKEIERISKPGSFCCAVWNDRNSTPKSFNAKLEEILSDLCSSYRTMRKPHHTILDLHKLVPSGKEVFFPHKERHDLKGLIGRMASTSYVAQENGSTQEKINVELRKAFEVHETNGYVTIDYHTKVFYWST